MKDFKVYQVAGCLNNIVKLSSDIRPDFNNVTGDFIEINTSDIQPFTHILVDIPTIQSGSGVPSTDNLRPFYGFYDCDVFITGENMWSAELFSAGTLISSSTGIPSQNANYNTYKIAIPSGDYLLSKYDNSSASNVTKRLVSYDSTDTPILSSMASGSDAGGSRAVLQFNVPDNALYTLVSLRVSSYDIMLEKNATVPSDFIAYSGATYHIDWSAEAGAVYGSIVDFVQGTLLIKKKILDLGSLEWSYDNGIFTAIIPDGKISNYITGNAVALCSASEQVYYSAEYIPDKKFAFGSGYISSNICSILFKNSDYSNASAFKTAMNGIYLVYEISTPVNVEITPQQINTLQGVNNIWASTLNNVKAEFTN